MPDWIWVVIVLVILMAGSSLRLRGRRGPSTRRDWPQRRRARRRGLRKRRPRETRDWDWTETRYSGPSSSLRTAFDLPYLSGPQVDELQRLDIYAPEDEEQDRPVVLWVHGGGWHRGDKKNVQAQPGAFCRRGYLFVSLNYRLAPAASFKEQAKDLARAVAWVKANIQQYGGSPRHLYMLGHSSGAHLAALVNLDERYLKETGLPLTTIKGVVLLDGAAYDIARHMEVAGPRNRRLYTSVFGTDPETHRVASPTTYIVSEKGIPPFLVIYVADRKRSQAQSERLVAALRRGGILAEIIIGSANGDSSNASEIHL